MVPHLSLHHTKSALNGLDKRGGEMIMLATPAMTQAAECAIRWSTPMAIALKSTAKKTDRLHASTQSTDAALNSSDRKKRAPRR
ncbi:hypothetical protein CXX84_03485 [Arthrobacter sp. AFG7.2]|nr:hypothetical protein CXX84_03485 [Arthrobacter sp. AFG7.2]